MFTIRLLYGSYWTVYVGRDRHTTTTTKVVVSAWLDAAVTVFKAAAPKCETELCPPIQRWQWLRHYESSIVWKSKNISGLKTDSTEAEIKQWCIFRGYKFIREINAWALNKFREWKRCKIHRTEIVFWIPKILFIFFSKNHIKCKTFWSFPRVFILYQMFCAQKLLKTVAFWHFLRQFIYNTKW